MSGYYLPQRPCSDEKITVFHQDYIANLVVGMRRTPLLSFLEQSEVLATPALPKMLGEPPAQVPSPQVGKYEWCQWAVLVTPSGDAPPENVRVSTPQYRRLAEYLKDIKDDC